MEDSSNNSKPRCQCGFWGSPQTLGLCSVCYRKASSNQSQGSSLTSDAGKSALGSCHTQPQQSNGQGSKMDSRHFPSRSTTDNLPSSLSSPPGERAALSAAAPATAMNDASTSTPTTTSCSSATNGAVSSSSSHHPNLMSPEAKGSSDGDNLVAPTVMASTVTKVMGGTGEQPQQQVLPITQTPSDTDTCSSTSSDLSYDPKRDPALLCSSASSDSCSSSLVSVASSTTAAILNPLPSGPSYSSIAAVSRENITSQSSGPQPSSQAGMQQTLSAESSASTMQPSNSSAATLSRPSPVAIKVPSIRNSNTLSSSTKSTVTHMDKADKEICSSLHRTGTSVNEEPLTNANNLIQAGPSIASPADRGTKRSRDEMEATSEKSSPANSPQKNKKRCFICSCKLELAQRTIGKCRCGRVFCALHRLPELHDCEFNHKEDGRREAREKMIKPTRHLGPSYRREENS